MANYCYNYIVFKGANVGKLKEAFGLYKQTEYFDDFVHLATGKPIEDKKDPYRYGTRWFEFETELVDSETLVVSGDSAWSPVEGMTQAFCEHFSVSARIEFEESGCDFGGYTEYDEQGNVTDSLTTTYAEWSYIQDSDSAVHRLVEDIMDGGLEMEDIEDMISHLTQEDKDYVLKQIENA
jgi:hypothetical protein